ncbi:uncharacterized protein METZ01_LOCUS343316, partial [marine metagenome]
VTSVHRDNGFLRVICVPTCVPTMFNLCTYGTFTGLAHNGHLRRFQRRVGDDGVVKENLRQPKLTSPTLV